LIITLKGDRIFSLLKSVGVVGVVMSQKKVSYKFYLELLRGLFSTRVVCIRASTRWKSFYRLQLQNNFHPVLAHIRLRVEGRFLMFNNNTKGIGHDFNNGK
jgi:hypothetical protein